MGEKPKLYKINAVFLGESGVGKTSIIRRLLGEEFDENVKSTIGVTPHFIENIKFINEEEDNSEISIQIWDTAGQEKYFSIGKEIVQRADILIFVRDNLQYNFEKWFNFVENLIDIEAKKVIYCLNKTDLMSEKDKKNIIDELKNLNRQKKHHATIQCVSSKNSDGIFNLQNLLEEKSQEKVSNELKRHKYNINIILIGRSSVGKSSLIERIINNSFGYSSPTIAIEEKYVKVDLKNHSSINYTYFDVCGQELYISTWIHFLDKVDIIIFVNEKDRLDVDTSIIEKRVLLSNVKIICCINKKDLFSDAENEKTIKEFKEKNKKLEDKPIILVSAKTSEGIDKLKDKINEYSINIVDKKINEFEIENNPFNLDYKQKNKRDNKKDEECFCL